MMPMTDEQLDTMLADHTRAIRNTALEAAAEMCEQLAADGACAMCCALAIRDLMRRIDARTDEVTKAMQDRPAKVN